MDALFDVIIADVQTIVQHVLTLRPDVLLLQPSYDYPRPLPSGTPLEVNTAAENLATRIQTLADSIAGMSFENLNGLMQIHFGLPGLGLPPFDPSLPGAPPHSNPPDHNPRQEQQLDCGIHPEEQPLWRDGGQQPRLWVIERMPKFESWSR